MQLLRVLHMANCKLEAVPLELPLLRGLRHLHLSGNLIYELPSTLAALSRLETLDLRRNRVHRVPGVVTALAALSTLDLSENGELQFDAAAVAVAALPRLRNFSFPRPCESFCWTAAAVRPLRIRPRTHALRSTHHQPSVRVCAGRAQLQECEHVGRFLRRDVRRVAGPRRHEPDPAALHLVVRARRLPDGATGVRHAATPGSLPVWRLCVGSSVIAGL